MITLKRITGETLQLVFNPQGALSSAKLEDRSVTHHLRYIRQSDFQESLRLIGFKAEWEPHLVEAISFLDKQLAKEGMMVFNIELDTPPLYHVFLCDSNDPHFLHKRTRAVMHYDIQDSRFKNIVRLFELDYARCKQLMEVAYVPDSQAVQS
jgi:hypothetical protein